MRFFLLIFLFCLPLLGYGQQKQVILWGDKPLDFRQKQVVLYYFPCQKSDNKKNTAVIFCPGGSYCYLAKENEGFAPAKLFCEHGFDSFVLFYRRGIKGNRYPSQIQDLQKAIIYVRDNYDFDKIGVCGFSAGGHLSGTSAIYYDKNFVDSKSRILKTDFNIMIYPVVTMQDDYVHKKSCRNLLGQYYNSQLKDSMSLERHLDRNLPPLFVIACKDDPIVDYRNSVRFADSLKNADKVYKFQLYEHGGHGFGVNPSLIKCSDKQAALWYEDFFDWFDFLFKSF